MKLSERDKIWIHRYETNSLHIYANWNGIGDSKREKNNFSHSESEELFNLIKDAIQAKYPNIVINPWSNAEHGTLD